MNRARLSRRRLLCISAAAGISGAVVKSVPAQTVEWSGPVLGGEGRLLFDGISHARARALVAEVVGEVDRLEQVFSLHRSHSELCRLNRHGVLEQPSHDLTVVLSAAIITWQSTDGLFNPAMQPVWQWLSAHFAGPAADREPDAAELAAVLERCDPIQIDFDSQAIRLAPEMALSLNGIAQGYIADKIAELLQSQGLADILVQLGETRALPGRAWPLSVAGHRRRFTLAGGAVATSAGMANRFTPDGRWHHLIDPRTGRSGRDIVQVTVHADSALMADALSTALAVSDRASLPRLVSRFPEVSVLAELPDGSVLELGDPWPTASNRSAG